MKPVVQNGKLFLDTPAGPSEPVDLGEFVKLYRDDELLAIKEKVDAELNRRFSHTPASTPPSPRSPRISSAESP